MNQAKTAALLWMSERIGPAAQRKVMDQGGLEGFFERTESEWIALGLSPEEAVKLAERKNRERLDSRLETLERRDVRILIETDADWPVSSVPEALPPILFARGRATHSRPGLAVVGSRKPSAYGLEIARAIGREAGLRGVALVSGAALGIDMASHEGALDAKGTTLAVLGCGILVAYPPQAKELLDRIADQGMVLSQFFPEMEPRVETFPIRNKTIAALSESVVAVEGTLTSGTRHTVRFAREFGLRVFAVPGEITRPQAALPNRLLAEGALVVTHPADPVDPLRRKGASQLDLTFGADPKEKVVQAAEVPDSPLMRRLLDEIRQGRVTVDELLSLDLAPAGELNEALLALELGAWVRQEPGRRYAPTLKRR